MPARRTSALLVMALLVVLSAAGALVVLRPADSAPSLTTLPSSQTSGSLPQASQSASTTAGSTPPSSSASSQTSRSAMSTNQSTSTSGPAGGVELAAASLYAGTASSPTSQGTAALYLVLHDPGPGTRILSVTLEGADLGSPPTIFQCSTLTSCSTPSSLAVIGYGDTSFSNSTSAFFVGHQVNENATYTYTVALANGQTISGSLVAFSKLARP